MQSARVFIAAAVAGLCACSLLVGDLADLKTNADASDASSDAPLDAVRDAEAGSLCKTSPPGRLFCADFDEVPYLANFVPSILDGSGGGVTDADFVSPPNAFLGAAPAVGDASYPPSAFAVHHQALPQGARSFSVGFSFLLDKVDPSQVALFFLVAFAQSDFKWEIELATQLSILHELSSDGGVDTSFPISLQSLFGGWHRVVLRFDASDGGAGVVTLTCDGQSIFQNAASQPSSGGAFVSPTLDVQVGVLASYGPESAVSAYYDDVTIDSP